MYQDANVDQRNIELTPMPVARSMIELAATEVVQAHQSTSKPQAPVAVIRHYLVHLTPEILHAQAFTDELAMRAKIIAEYMQRHAIQDVNQGIRAFTTFERERLQRLGLLAVPRARV